MLLFVLAFAAASDTSPASNPARCGRPGSYYARQPGAKVAPRTLTELLNANIDVAVDRRIGGCEAPVVARYKVTGR